MAGFIPSLQTMQTMLKGGAASVAGGAALGAGLLYYGQNFLIYPSGFPQGSRTDVATPMQYNMCYHDVTLETPDNIRIKAYLMLQRQEVPATNGVYQQAHIYAPSKKDVGGEGVEIPIDQNLHEEDLKASKRDILGHSKMSRSQPTVLIFHANAGNMGHRLPLARLFYERMRCNVFMLSYRGYGLSEGRPSESGIRMDAQAALDFVRSHPLLKSTKLIIFGQSIGGAVTIDLAGRNPDAVHGVIVENTFLSIPELIPSVMPYLSSVSFLCHQHWRSSTSVLKIPRTTPMLMISGLKDEVVPPPHMKRLWEIATSTTNAPEVEMEDEETDGEEKKIDDNSTGDEEKLVRRSRRVRKGARWWMEFEEGAHNNTCMYREYWAEVARFMQGFSKMV
ncbi:hypothetical protein FRB97_005589 [Tulasnella sp. 331]|nr:hypothetical protein FRB97_005589 [Tulasnella sp. 331]